MRARPSSRACLPPADLKDLAKKGARGGLGLTLVQRIADTVVREREGPQNVCRLVKRLPQNPLSDKEKLASAEFQLRTLVDLGREFSTNFDPARVASIALASLMGHLTILRAAFLTSTPDGRVRVLASRGVKNVMSLEGIPWDFGGRRRATPRRPRRPRSRSSASTSSSASPRARKRAPSFSPSAWPAGSSEKAKGI